MGLEDKMTDMWKTSMFALNRRIYIELSSVNYLYLTIFSCINMHTLSQKEIKAALHKIIK